MTPLTPLESNSRILIVDDNRAIHDDLCKILCGEMPLQEDEAFLFGTVPVPVTEFQIDSAYQGKEGLEKVKQALAEGRPYALAFVDVRMPPGWDGVETIVRFRQVDPNLQTVICTAYSDYSWTDMQRRLGHSDNLLILKKPFDNVEIIQLAHALTRKWLVTRQAEAKMADLDRMVAQRTAELQTAHEQLKKEFAERAKAEEAFRIIFQASPIAISLLDGEHRYVDANRAFETQHGLAKAVILGKTPSELGLVDGQTQHELCWQMARDGAISEKEVVHMPASGERTSLLWVRNVEIGSAPHALEFCLDITQRKAMEEQLRQARSAAEAASKIKSEFLANMSHEIRTPMNGVVGFTQVLLGTELNAEQRDCLETVESSAGLLMRIINDILDFSKIEAGCLEVEAAPFSLRECVEGAAKTMLAVAQEKGLDLQWEISPEIPDGVAGDAVRLRQVLLNLIGNAVKFTAKGLVRVEVAPEQVGQSNVLAHFRVRDTGIGVPADKQEFIFEPFRQGDGSVTRRYGGTGLGLAISARLVALMGGRIWVESAERQGSTFHFTTLLNLVKPADSGAGYGDVGANVPLSILVAEDDAVSRRLVAALLQREGHAVTVASNGVEALSIVERQSFDVILMDIQMPVMDGLQVTAEIRKQESRTGAHVPIVALTAHAMKRDRERCLEAGMDEYIPKPINPAELLAAVAGLVAKPVAVTER
jgi:PAS domain S-box-containing protein